MVQKPLIGLILDKENLGSFSKYPYYALRVNYFDTIIKAGALPIGIPYSNPEDAKKYYNLIDGLVIPGGGFDIPPEMYGEHDVHETVSLKRDRTEFEYEMAKKCLDNDKPMLGICGGMQLINVLTGGSLIQDIPSQFESKIAHRADDRTIEAHKVDIIKNTRLYDIVQQEKFGVNTAHHQGIKKLGNDLIVNALSDEDGLIEGIEHTDHKFCLGVQWHPEYEVTGADFKIIKAFIDSCGK